MFCSHSNLEYRHKNPPIKMNPTNCSTYFAFSPSLFFFCCISTCVRFVINILELPWDEPTTGCGEFVKWRSDNSWMTISPWKKLETLVLSMLRKILDPESDKRLSIQNIIDHKWCKTKNLPLGMYPKWDYLIKFIYFNV